MERYSDGDLKERLIIKYWRNKLTADHLYLHHTTPAAANTKEIKFDIPAAALEQINSISNGNAMAAYTIHLALYALLVNKYFSVSQVIIAAPPLNGAADNNAPLFYKLHLSDEDAFKALIRTCGEEIQETIKHKTYDYKHLEEIILANNIQQASLYQFGFSHAGITAGTPFEQPCPLHLHIDATSITCRFDTQVHPQSVISSMVRSYELLLNNLRSNLEQTIKKIDLLSATDGEQLLAAFNKPRVVPAGAQTIIGLFEEQVSKTPDDTAVIFEDTILTYQELNARSNELAAWLRLHYQLKADDLAGIKLERNEWLIIAILGVLKAGGAYVPIDPDYPEERIDYMLADSRCKVLIDASFLTAFREVRDNYSSTNLPSINHPADLAYVIYTSGSTGRPKGVMIEHRNTCTFIKWCFQEFKDAPVEVVLGVTSICFDLSVFEIFYTLCSGKKLRLLSSALSIPQHLHTPENILLNTVPSVVGALLDEHTDLRSVSVLNMAGEPIPRHYLDSLDYENTEIRNLYGPTEYTTYSTCYRIKDHHHILIGQPVDNTAVYILNENQGLQPVNVAGEICISGDGLARGYLNKPELTAEKFVSDPFNPGERMYKTGDLGKWLPDGNIAYLGRIDNQVKIRGFRIEPAEIENVLLEHPHITLALVVPVDNQYGEKELAAYIVSGKTVSIPDVRLYLRALLPAYMLPDHLVQLPAFPLTPNGKVDRKKLPSPYAMESTAGENYVAPRNETEEKLIRIWEEILGKDKIGIKDNFFELGGHSLKATRLTSHIHKVFEAGVTLKELFANPVLEVQAALIQQAAKKTYINIEPAPVQDYYALSSAQKRLFFLQELAPQSTGYNMPMAIYLNKTVNTAQIRSVLKQLLSRHHNLSTSFEKIKGVPWQKVHQEVAFELEEHECTTAEFDAYMQGYIRPFDLSKAPLVRSALVHIKETGYIWVIDMHHIISDGTSMQVLADDFMHLYHGEQLPELRLQYKDFSAWQNGMMERGELAGQQQFWLSQFATGLPVLNMPADRPRPAVFNYEGAVHSFTLPHQLTEKLKRLGENHHGTLQMTLLCVLNILFHKYTGQEDIVIGCNIAGRRHPDVERIVGMFVNTLAVRSFPRDDKSFDAFYNEVIATCIAAYEHQDVQFEDLLNLLQPERDLSRNPVFDIALVVQNFTRSAALDTITTAATDTAVTGQWNNSRKSKFDMTWFVEEREQDLLINIEYYTAIYDHTTIEKLATHFSNILQAVSDHPDTPIAAVRIMTPAEEQELLETFAKGEERAYPTGTVHSLFEEQSRRTPDHLAVTDETGSLTYSQLNASASQLSNFLREKLALKPEERVAILQTRSKELIVSILAVLKAGAAYLPLDNEYPIDRILFMLEDAGVEILITEKSLVEFANRLQWRCRSLKHLVCVDSDNIYTEMGGWKNGLMSKDLWEHVGNTATDAISGGGWTSSFTGAPLSEIEMQEYSRNAYIKLKEHLHPEMKVLEIGCASGLTMFRIAPEVGTYVGTDLSSTILEKTGNAASEKGYTNITLTCLAADQIDQLTANDFDLIVINSVVQCFNGHNYLREVLVKAIAKLKTTGLIFLGDLMDEDKRETFIQDLTAFKQADPANASHTKTDQSAELFVSRAYLDDLIADHTGIVTATYSDKIYTIANELTAYRFDALLKVDKQQAGKVTARNKYQYARPDITTYDTASAGIPSRHQDLAYIIYTSGSTGNPKGVMIEHGGLVNSNFARNAVYGNIKSFLLLSSIAFDSSVAGIFGTLCYGGQLFLAKNMEASNVNLIAKYVIDNKISHLLTVPSYYKLLVNIFGAHKNSLEMITVAGDMCPVQLVAHHYSFESLQDCGFFNEWGATECSVWSSVYQFDKNEIIQSVGKPILNTFIYVIDKQNQLVPAGVTGELCIGGTGVGRGYLNNPELTAQKFTENPFRPGERMYRTGDLGKWLPDGNVEFLSRKDDQVKIRGYRIELGEIESTVQSHPEVDAAAVIARINSAGEKELVAYLVSDTTLSVSDIRSWLSQTLPVYMLPSHFVQLKALPLNQNGKVDRKNLPDPEGLGMAIGVTYTPPENETEEQLALIWSTVLNREKPGTLDNFFESGGHSLKAVQMVYEIHQQMGYDISISQVFSNPTIRSLAGIIATRSSTGFENIPPASPQPYYELSDAQKRLWVLSKFDGGLEAYNIPGLFSLKGHLHKDAFKRAFNQLLQRHEILRTAFIETENGPRQLIHDNIDFNIEEGYLPATGEKADAALQEMVKEYIARPFDLTALPLIRAKLVQLPDNQYALLLVMHHIIADGWSMKVFARELIAYYNGIANGQEIQLPPLAIQYKDYSAWLQNGIDAGFFKPHQQYWLKKLEGPLPLLDLPRFKPYPEKKSFAGKTIAHTFSEATSLGLKQLSRNNNTSLYITLLAILKALLYKYTGQTDIIIGSEVHGREHKDLDGQIGFYTNTIPLRSQWDGDISFTTFFNHVKETALTAWEHQSYPFNLLVEELNIKRTTNHSPLFDVMVAWHDFHDINEVSGNTGFTGLELSLMDFDYNVSIYDLVIVFIAEKDGIIMRTNYNTDVFEADQVTSLFNHLEKLSRLFLQNPLASLDDYPLLLEEEKALLYSFHQNKSFLPPDTLPEIISRIAHSRPDAAALQYNGQVTTYQQLETAGNKTAHFLASLQLPAPSVIGVLMDRSPVMVETILGIWKAGMVYLPLDTHMPYERMVYMLRDAQLPVLITESKYLHIANNAQWESDHLQHIHCTDTDDVHGVIEPALDAMDKEMWEFIGNKSNDTRITGGWVNSFTGEYFSAAEMDEFAENVYQKVKPWINKATKVLEIGCASGITMFKVAPHVKHYHGIDLSQVIIDKNTAAIQEKGITNITLQCLYAHELNQLAYKDVDLVIINSVSQYFNGTNYFRDVIQQCIDCCSNNAVIFVGDVMDHDLKDTLIAHLKAFKTENTGKGYTTVTDFPDNQFFSRRYFDDLRFDLPEITAVQHSGKIFTIENELTTYRFDSLFTIDKNSPATVPVGVRNKYQHDAGTIHKQGADFPKPRCAPGDLAYIIYTSGSTGSPKAAMVEHIGMLNHLYAKINDLHLSAGSVVAQNAPQSFDISIWQFFVALATGGKTVVYSQDLVLDPESLIQKVKEDKVTVLEVVPSYLATILDIVKPEGNYRLDHLEWLVVTGETLKPGLVRDWFEAFPEIKLVNAYGPTEASDDITHYIMDKPPAGDNIPIGHPVQNFNIYIADKKMNLCPVGVKGEICVAGTGVGRGYLNNPEKTAAAFINNPFDTEYPRLYKTGDIGRYLPDGAIEFFGRKDQQIKIRGHRIEPGEIENKLLAITGLKEAVVIDRDQDENTKYLCGYYTVEADSALTADDLKKILGSQLPDYMVPQYLFQLDALPLTPNGKINRKALPALDHAAPDRNFILPRNETEKCIAAIWQEVLKITAVSINDDFFELGGHSLRATQVVAKIHRQLHVKLSLPELFEHNTIATQAALVLKKEQEKFIHITPVPEQAYYELSYAQRSLWLVEKLDSKQSAYNIPIAVKLKGQLNREAFDNAYYTVIKRHESLRTTFHEIEGEPRQSINSAQQVTTGKYKIKEQDLTTLPDKEQVISAIAGKEALQPFDLKNGPLIRAQLLRTQADEHVFLCTLHHIVFDGWSAGLFIHEFLTCYTAIENGTENPLPPLAIQYKDYASWQSRQLNDPGFEQHRTFWKNQFRDGAPLLALPHDYKRPQQQPSEGRRISFEVSPEITPQLQQLLRAQELTTYMGLLALVYLLFYKYSGQTDIVLGSSSAGRDHTDLENQIGYYVNVLAIRTRFNGDGTFLELLQAVKHHTLNAFAHKAYPFQMLTEDLQSGARNGNTHPVFNVMVDLNNNEVSPPEDLSVPGLKVLPINTGEITSKFDLTFDFSENKGTISCSLEYDTGLFEEDTIRLLQYRFNKLAAVVVNTPDILLSETDWSLDFETSNNENITIPDELF